MQKRTWLVALFLVAALVVTLGISPIFADGSADTDEETWEEMHQACENGDYEAMAEWHTQCHDGDGAMGGGMMGGGMMGRGMMGGSTMGSW